MLKFWFVLLFLIFTNGQSTFAQKQLLRVNNNLAFHSEGFLGLQNGLKSSDRGISKFNIKYDTDNSASQLALNFDGYSSFNHDGSYFQYSSGIATFGLGAVGRHWSFSDNTSLILTHNARPTKSIYLKLEDKFKYVWLPSEANWSLEAFNGLSEGSFSNARSMIAGFRIILTPVEGLNFELVQTSQWGGKGHSTGISALGTALLLDSNSGSNSNINKMAGFGISYTMPTKEIPLRIYGQAIGEDEAGNLPSCFTYLAGIEWTNKKIKYPTTVSIETIDTRIDKTRNGFCGPNTMYNNSTYDYTNYGKVMGAAIDTEGTSLGIYIDSQISQKVNIELVTKSVVINDNNWSGHRLSSKRETGLVNSLGVSWNSNNLKFNVNIYNQDYTLDKADIKNGSGISFSSSVTF